MYDPYTGLVWPLRIEKATITATTGLPIGATHDWVTLKFQDKVVVPGDAFVDWDATTQKFITAAEKSSDEMTAKVQSIVYYPSNLLNNVTWHDGSKLSVADFLMSMIMIFDRANKASAIYDEQAVPNFESFTSAFKAFQITDTSPLTVEYYTDYFAQDAELERHHPLAAVLLRRRLPGM